MNEPDKKPTTRYYHGGNRGLKVGQFILPPSETGKNQPPTSVPRRSTAKIASMSALGWRMLNFSLQEAKLRWSMNGA